jgi:hypothetical protein
MGHKSQCKKQICGRGVVNEKENGCHVLWSLVIVSCVCAELWRRCGVPVSLL